MSQKQKISLLSWNVRGLSERPKRLAVRQAILTEKPDIVTLQETKLSHIDSRQKGEIFGHRLDGFEFLPAQGTRGGIMVAWNQRTYTKVNSEIKEFSITIHFKHNCEANLIALTAVYGPTSQRERRRFFQEIRQSKPEEGVPWIIGGDFNVTAEPEERTSNDNTWRATVSFASLISELELINLTLAGQNFTWSNERARPHMARLDRFIISAQWNLTFPNSSQKTIANTSSDHSPVLFTARTNFRKSRFFRFEKMWLHSQPLKDMIKEAWTTEPAATTPVQLHDKLTRLKQKITAWTKERIGNIKAQVTACRTFLEWMAKAREQRQITQLERLIVAIIKGRHTALAVLEEDIWRTRARTNWELKGDRGTKYFHAIASGSKRNNCITQIEINSVIYSDQPTKARAFFDFFKDLMGTAAQNLPNIHWDNLYPTQVNMEALTDPITRQEIE